MDATRSINPHSSWQLPYECQASNAFTPTSLSGLRGSRVSTHLPCYWSTRWGCLVSGEVIQSLSPGSLSAPSFRHSPWWSPPGTRSLPSPGGSPLATRVSAFLTAAPHPELSLSPNLHIFLLCFLCSSTVRGFPISRAVKRSRGSPEEPVNVSRAWVEDVIPPPGCPWGLSSNEPQIVISRRVSVLQPLHPTSHCLLASLLGHLSAVSELTL